MIYDQRYMTGGKVLTTPVDVETAWRGIFADRIASLGFCFPERRDSNEPRVSRRKLSVYLNHRRWVADCPMDDCNGGIAVWVENPRACCLDCGTFFSNIDWPSETDRAKVEVIAAMVPMDEMVNWFPAREEGTKAVERLREVAVT